MIIRIIGVLLGSICATGCTTSLVNERVTDDFNSPGGVPWIEAREYDVYVYVMKKGVLTPLHYERYALSDKVNGTIIDADRPKWAANYDAAIFSDGGLSLSFHENGSLKEAKVSSQPGTGDALSAAGEGLGIGDKIEAKELEQLERENKIREAKKAQNSE